MVKKLAIVGNSLGIIIDRPILDLLNIDKDTPLDVSTDGKSLIIRPATASQRARLKQSAGRMMQAHDKTFKKLARE
ncbi:MAG: AbrB/MazE/SpoVT family DNA-binding domain-containing protein [Deltaproteobacteria bacterium]|nr:AbrB/MazE/SpoVT family DNA-binding domain-containing protein [Deltaproteobacteria bacterium]